MSNEKNYEQKFDKLRKRFDMATEVVEGMSDDLDDLSLCEVPEPGQNLPMDPLDPDNPEVFTIQALKCDFVLIRQNVIRVINYGNNLLDQVSVLDVGDMKASQLTALATLQKTLGDNVKLLMDIYKDIIVVERGKADLAGKTNPDILPGQGQMNVKGDVHQQIVVAGSTSDLLHAIKPPEVTKEPTDVTPDENNG